MSRLPQSLKSHLFAKLYKLFAASDVYAASVISDNPTMLQITLYFWQMCLLRVGPDKVPSSLPILLTALAGYLVVAFISVNLIRPSLSFGDLCGSLAVEVLIEGSLVYGILWLKKTAGRAIPTLISLFATNTIILVFLLMVNLLLVNSDAELLGLFAKSAFWVIFFWSLAIVGFIFHRSMEISVFQGIALAFTLEVLTIAASQMLFPTQTLT